jgi:hypothetical protein
MITCLALARHASLLLLELERGGKEEEYTQDEMKGS